MQAKQKSIINIASGLFGQLMTIACGVLIPRLVMVSYGSEINGLLNSISQIFVYFGLFEAGVGTASVQALYAPVAKNNRDDIQGILAATKKFYFKIGILYFTAVVLLAVFYPFLLHTSIPYSKIFLIIFFGGAGNCLCFFYQDKYTVLMSAEGKNYVYTNVTTFITTLTSIAKVILLLMGYNVLAVQFSYFVICFFQVFVYSIYLRKNYSWIDWNAKPNNKAIEQKNSTLVHQIASVVFYNTDPLILTSITHDLKIVSVYTIYNMVTSMVTALVQQLSQGISFRLGQLFNTEREQYVKLHHICEIIYMTLAFAAMTTTYVVLPAFIRLYTKGVTDINYYEKLYPLLFVLIPLFTIGRTAMNNVIYYAAHFKQTQMSAVLECVINITVSVIGVWEFGIYGVLIGSVVSVVYRTIYMIFYCYRHILFDSPWKTIRRWLVCLVIFALMVVFVPSANLPAASYLQIILYGAAAGAISLIVYFVALCLTNRKETQNIISIVRGIF